MANLLETINNWFQSIGLGTDWTITWEVLLSFGTAVVSLFAFTTKYLFSNTASEPTKTDFEHQQKVILEEQSAIYFNGEVVIFFAGLYYKGASHESAKSKVKFISKNGKFIEKDFDIFTNGEWRSNSLSFQGFNDYEIQLTALERGAGKEKPKANKIDFSPKNLLEVERDSDNEKSKATYSVIKIPKKIRFFKKLQSITIAISIGLLSHAILLARFGTTVVLSGFSIPIIMLSGLVTWIAWLWKKN